jgi:hypothetical protein
MLVQHCGPCVNLVVLHRQGGTDAEVDELVAIGSQDCVDPPKYLVELVRVGVGVLVKHPVVVHDAVRARGRFPGRETAEEQSRRHVVPMPQVSGSLRPNTGCIVPRSPTTEWSGGVEATVEDRDPQVGVYCILSRKWRSLKPWRRHGPLECWKAPEFRHWPGHPEEGELSQFLDSFWRSFNREKTEPSRVKATVEVRLDTQRLGVFRKTGQDELVARCLTGVQYHFEQFGVRRCLPVYVPHPFSGLRSPHRLQSADLGGHARRILREVLSPARKRIPMARNI